MDWDDEDFEPPTFNTGKDAPTNWDDEDEEEDDGLSYTKASAPKNAEKQAKKNKFKDNTKGEVVDEALADPVAEKLRQQRLVEEADYAATKELFGGGGDKSLDDFIPKSQKDYEALGNMVAAKYLSPHANSAHYTALCKALLREAMITLPAGDIKEVESSVIVMRNERMKAEKELAGKGKKAQKKAQLNSGANTKGSKSAGLDDFQYDDVGVDDDYDFM